MTPTCPGSAADSLPCRSPGLSRCFAGGKETDDAAGEVTSAGTLPSPKPKPPTTRCVNANKWTSLAEGEAEAKTAAALRHGSSDSRDGGREGGGGGGDSGGGYRELKIEWKETLLRGSREKSSYLLLGWVFFPPSRSCYDDTMSGGGPDESSVRVALR